MKNISANLRQIIDAIESAVSLVGMNDINHGKRVAYIAYKIGKEHGYTEETLDYIVQLGMLHDCGVSSDRMHANLANEFDWKDADIHCNTGYKILKYSNVLAKYANPIRYHHTKYIDLKEMNIDEEEKEYSNLIFLADRIDIKAFPHYNNDIDEYKITLVSEMIEQYSNIYFDPELVESFIAAQEKSSFWPGLKEDAIMDFFSKIKLKSDTLYLNINEVMQIALILSYLVDQKSSFTGQHSFCVAELAGLIAKIKGFSYLDCQKIKIAGLLHDLGKLSIPDEILNKSDRLNNNELEIMGKHSLVTYRILSLIDGFKDITQWAACHHEYLNGEGYPFRIKENDISIESRIIAVADVFQALVQERPYRKSLCSNEVISILDKMVNQKKLDVNIVDVVKNNIKDFLEVAMNGYNEFSLVDLSKRLSLISF